MDFSKAFDKVAHNRRAYKLHQFGIRGHTLEWIENFLSGQITVCCSGRQQATSYVSDFRGPTEVSDRSNTFPSVHQ